MRPSPIDDFFLTFAAFAVPSLIVLALAPFVVWRLWSRRLHTRRLPGPSWLTLWLARSRR